MSATFLNSTVAGALTTNYLDRAIFWTTIEASAKVDIQSSLREGRLESAAYNDFVYNLQRVFIIFEPDAIQSWLNSHSKVYASLFEAADQIELIFGGGRPMWLSLLEDWEGETTLEIEVGFEGSGEEASNLCGRFISEWLVNQEYEVSQFLIQGVRFA